METGGFFLKYSHRGWSALRGEGRPSFFFVLVWGEVGGHFATLAFVMF